MPESGPRAAAKRSSFRGLLWTQALSAFNDNSFKTLVALHAVATMDAARSSGLISLAGALFMIPFVLLSTYAGDVSDKYGKRDLLVLLKWVELGLMAAATLALYLDSIPLLLLLLFLMGAHSAFISPVKLAILPEMVSSEELSRANGLVSMFSFLGILAGTAAAGLLAATFAGRLHLAGGVFLLSSAAGVWAARRVEDLPASRPDAAVRLNALAQARGSLREMSAHYGVLLATLASAYFWFLGAILQMNILVYGKELMGLGERAQTGLQMCVAAGIGMGSYAAGRLSRDRVELGLVPLGALGLVLFSLDLSSSFRSGWRTATDLALLGYCGGCFSLPLQAYIQQRSPAEKRGSFIATGNLVTFIGVLLSSAFLWLWTSRFGLNPGQVFLASSLMTAAVTVYIISTLPDFLLRLLFYPLANLVYRIQVEGEPHVPTEGPALLVSNHVSFVDPFLIGGATRRMVRFLMFRRYYELPVFSVFFRAMGCIAISDTDSPRAILASFKAARKALEDGEVVCIFAEGEITRHGQMLRFRKGFERIVTGTSAPIIPVHLDRVWGSIFSFEGGRVLFKRPRRIPYPVTVSFGRPIPSTSTAYSVRQAILELGAEAFRHRLAEKPPLAAAFLREAKRRPGRQALADSSGRRLSAGRAAVEARVLALRLRPLLRGQQSVGVLLPPSVAGALANMALTLEGQVAVNLNYTASPEIVRACMQKASLRSVVTSRAFLSKLGWEAPPGALFLEDQVDPRRWPALVQAAAFRLLPAALLERLWCGRVGLEEPAAVIFTSGSTGVPKGVVLAHSNILSNIEALGQVLQISERDTILGVLPFFHSFGYTVTLWFPLLAGFSAVYHPNPLDAKRVGELAAEHGATFLLGTPTFLAAYLRRIEPENLKTLRLAVAGAEKLREEVARAFAERFGLRPLEGYGCTELSPVAAMNIPDVIRPEDGSFKQRGTKPGTIGQPLPGVLLKVVDPESGADLPEGRPGLILVKGPNVMKGYLGEPERTAQALRGGFYHTGDIGAIDEDGFVTITDRLSRFSKIGGEMVPHIKVEERLHELAGLVEQAFVVTGVPDERRGERLVVLCKGYEDVEGLWRRLQASDLPKLWIPAREDFRAVDSFPLLGSGKLDFVRLKERARELTAAA